MTTPPGADPSTPLCEIVLHGITPGRISPTGPLTDPGWYPGRAGEVVLRATPLGVRPLAWRRIAGVVHLARHSSVLARLAPRASLDMNALTRLSRRDFPTGGGWFTGVHRVPGGTETRLEASGTAGEPARWFRMLPEPGPGEVEPDVLELVIAACGRSLEGRRRAAVMLSGGIDSSVVALAAAEASRRAGLPPPVLLSATYPELACDERRFQDAVALRLGLDQIRVDGTVVPLWPSLEAAVAWHGAPLIDGQEEINLRLYRAAGEQGCDLVFAGIGGDEMFEGRGLEVDLLRRGHWRRALRLIGSTIEARPRPRLRTYLRRAVRIPLQPGRLGVTHEAARRFGTWCRARLDRTLADAGLDWRLEMAARTAARAGLTLSAPFLEEPFVTTFGGVSWDRLAGSGTVKSLLREAVRGKLPQPVVERVLKADFAPYYEARLDRDLPALTAAYDRLYRTHRMEGLPPTITPLLKPPFSSERFLTAWMSLTILLLVEAWPSSIRSSP
ncbi:MAG: asparagine synthase-related protein [Gemmatimonadales bacterium]